MKKKYLMIILIAGFLLSGCTSEQIETTGVGILDPQQQAMEAAETEFNYTVPVSRPNVLINQVGYQTDSVKTVVFRGDLLGESFQVVNADTNKIVYTGDIGKNSYQTEFMENTATGTFTQVTKPGTYYIQTAYIGQSYTFQIGDNLYEDMLNQALLNLYKKRCGTVVSEKIAGSYAHRKCHLEYVPNSENSEEVYELSGGWHNDGDYGKDVEEACNTIAVLLLAYELYPEVFTDDTGIPESGNDIPDILDEIKYEMDWLLKMQDVKTGSVFQGIVEVNDKNTIVNDGNTEGSDDSDNLDNSESGDDSDSGVDRENSSDTTETSTNNSATDTENASATTNTTAVNNTTDGTKTSDGTEVTTTNTPGTTANTTGTTETNSEEATASGTANEEITAVRVQADEDTATYELLPTSQETTEEFIAILSKFAYSYKEFDTTYASQCLTAAEKAWKSLDAAEIEDSKQKYFFAAAELYRSIGKNTYRQAVLDYLRKENPDNEKNQLSYYGTLTYFMTKFSVDVNLCNEKMQIIMDESEEIASNSKNNDYEVYMTQGSSVDDILNAVMKLTVVEHIITNHEYAMVIENHLHYLLGKNTEGVSYVRGFGSRNSGENNYMDATSLRNATFILVLSEIVEAANESANESAH